MDEDEWTASISTGSLSESVLIRIKADKVFTMRAFKFSELI